MDKNVSDVWLGKKETFQDNSMQMFTVFSRVVLKKRPLHYTFTTSEFELAALQNQQSGDYTLHEQNHSGFQRFFFFLS